MLNSQCDCFALFHSSIQCLSLLQEFNLTDMSPARILVQQKTISESSDLYATCSTFGFKKQIMVYVYLCKDDRLYEKIQQKSDQYDTMFTISSVGLNVSGNYSCVYSTNEYLPDQVAKRGENIIQIQVIGKDCHSYESIMTMLFPSTHFVLLPHSQFSPCRYFSSWAVHSR